MCRCWSRRASSPSPWSAWPTRRWAKAASGCGRRCGRSGWRCRRSASRVNLSPADLAKEGSHYDLPIALGLLAAMGVIAEREPGGLRRAGRAGARRLADAACRACCRRRIAARSDGARRDLPGGVRRRGGVGWLRPPATPSVERPQIIAAPSLLALINHLRGQQVLPAPAGAGRRRSRAAIPTSPRSRARRAPSACSSSRRPAATIC